MERKSVSCPGGSVSRNPFLYIESADIRSFDKDSSAFSQYQKQFFSSPSKVFSTPIRHLIRGIDLAFGFDSITFRAGTWQLKWEHKSRKSYLIPCTIIKRYF
jgi:hypothetical protein